MPFTLRDVLALEVFKRAEAEVVAGEKLLSREVRWVHLPELLRIAPGHLSGGELVVIAGFDLGPSEGEQRDIIRRLARVPIAALVVELGRVFDEVPPPVLDEAERCCLPLIVLHRETYFVHITEQVSAAIINRQYRLLQHSESLARRFDTLLLTGASLESLLKELSNFVDNPVVLETLTHQVVAFAEYKEPVTHLLASWASHATKDHEESPSRGIGVSHAGGTSCCWLPVILHGEVWGRLHVIANERELHTGDGLALDRAVLAVGLALLSDRNAAHALSQAQGVTLTDVLNSRIVTSDELKHSAASVGVEFGQRRMLAAVIVPKVPEGQDLRRQAKARSRLMQETLAAIRGAAADTQCVLLSAVVGDSIFGIVGLPEGGDDDQALRELEERVCKSPGCAFGAVMGTSWATDQTPVRMTLMEAQEAAGFSELRGGGASRFSELTLDRILVHLDSELDTPRFVDAELGPLLAYDEQRSTRLLETLRVFLDTNGNRTAAARAVGIQRRSLYARLDAVERILGCCLDDPETRVNLYLALRSLDLLRHRPRLGLS